MGTRYERAVLTIATGKRVYAELAVQLAHSYFFWNSDNRIPFVVVTDHKEIFRNIRYSAFEVVEVERGLYGEGFTPKLYMDEFAPAKHTLFLDADCLCFRPIEFIFERFRGHAVSVIGCHISEGEWFGDVGAVLRRFNLSAMPRFNGGLYYLEEGEITKKVYATARELKPQYDAIGFLPLRGMANDEMLMSLAMAIHGQQPLFDDGTMMNSTLSATSGVVLDILSGRTRLLSSKEAPANSAVCDHHERNPAIVHFLGSDTESWPYTEEIAKLTLVRMGLPSGIIRLLTFAGLRVPTLAMRTVKNILRPLLHRLWGPRKVKPSKRE